MKKKKGFLLIEVICAISLLSIIAFHSLPIFYKSMVQHNIHREQEEIIIVAQNKMEELLSCVYQNEETFLTPDEKYQYEVTKDFKDNLCHISLTVKEKSNERAVTLEAYAKKGIYAD